jgi:hypothetical protein
MQQWDFLISFQDTLLKDPSYSAPKNIEKIFSKEILMPPCTMQSGMSIHDHFLSAYSINSLPGFFRRCFRSQIVRKLPSAL